MHSIPAVSVHPNGKWLCGQSLDNQIVTYSALDKFRQNRKKVFKGHTSSGYACQVQRTATHPREIHAFGAAHPLMLVVCHCPAILADCGQMTRSCSTL